MPLYGICFLSLSLVSTYNQTKDDSRLMQETQSMLRDSQDAIASQYASGRILINTRYQDFDDPSKPDIRIDAEISWKRNKYLMSYTASGPGSLNFGGNPMDATSAKPPINYVSYNGIEMRLFNRLSNVLFIVQNKDLPSFQNPLLTLTPRVLILNCCPPTTVGRTWKEMIGLEIPNRSLFRAYEYTKPAANLIQQIRHDTDGGRQEILFDLQLAGSVKSTNYSPAAGKAPFSRSEYTWVKDQKDRPLLRKMKFRWAADKNFGSIIRSYDVEVLTLDLDASVAEALFERVALQKLLPSNVKVRDHTTDKTSHLNVTRFMDADTTKELINHIQKGSYMKGR